MKKPFIIAAFALTFFAISFQATAQKFGYVNSTEILSSLPEMKQADVSLEAFQKQYQQKGKKMVEELQANFQDIQKKQQEGSLSPKQLEAEEKKLRDQEAEISSFEQEMMTKIQEKRAELYEPILTRVNKAIQDVATENEFKFIFDNSPGSSILLYAEADLDITELVKAKLGVVE